MKVEKSIEIIATLFFIALAIFLVLVLFIQPVFMESVTSFIHSFGVFTIGGVGFSVGGTIAIILFFGFIIPSAFNKK